MKRIDRSFMASLTGLAVLLVMVIVTTAANAAVPVASANSTRDAIGKPSLTPCPYESEVNVIDGLGTIYLSDCDSQNIVTVMNTSAGASAVVKSQRVVIMMVDRLQLPPSMYYILIRADWVGFAAMYPSCTEAGATLTMTEHNTTPTAACGRP
jgi:hypothetical protein